MNPIQKLLIRRFLDSVKSLIEPLPVKSILDAGCGEGFVLDALVQARPDLSAIGADIDCEALGRGCSLFPCTPVVSADIVHLPYLNGSFDIIVCTEVLEHLPSPELALQELCRVSRRYCLLTVPHEPFFRIGNLVRGKSISRLGNDIEHLHSWSQAGFVCLLSGYLDLLAVKRSFPWLIALGQVR